MAKIEKTTIVSNAYTNIYNIVNNRSNIEDPRNATSTDNTLRTFIYDSDPLHLDLGFDYYPYIILELPLATLMEGKKSGDGTMGWIEWTQKITARSVRDGASNSLPGQGQTDILNMVDDLNETFNKKSILSDLRALNINKVRLIQINYDTFTLDNQLVYEYEFELSYMTRMGVS